MTMQLGIFLTMSQQQVDVPWTFKIPKFQNVGKAWYSNAANNPYGLIVYTTEVAYSIDILIDPCRPLRVVGLESTTAPPKKK